MRFSATHACAQCRVRFAPSDTCPSCGGALTFALATRDGRNAYRAATRVTIGGWNGLLLQLAPWSPRRAWLSISASLLAMAPLAFGVFVDPHVFQELWLMDDLTMKYEGLSSRGMGIIAIGVLGIFGLSFTLLARWAGEVAGRRRPEKEARFRVHHTHNANADRTTLTGIARKASVEIDAPLSGEPCLLFGLRGTAGDAEVADADGGDFDLELPNGERVMVSLEHAVLEAPPSEGEPAPLDQDAIDGLDTLLEERNLGTSRVALDEHLVRDGDTVTVIGDVVGGAVVTQGYRGGRARVIGGSATSLLIVELAKA